MTEPSRWKALRYYGAVQDKTAVVTLSKGAVVEGTVGSLNGRQTLLGLTEMKSPLGVYPRAVVKAEDVQRWEVDMSKEEAHRLLQLS